MSELNSVSTRSKPIGQYPGLASSSAQPPKLLDRLREALRFRHYSRRPEQIYCHWVKRFIYFHNQRHLVQMAEPEINSYLLKKVKALYERDLADGWGRVQMPTALDRKYPNAPKDWRWQWVFPQENRWMNPETKEQGRQHVDESLVQKAVRAAVARGGGDKTRHLPYFQTFIYDSSIGRRIRYSNRPRTPGPQ